MTATANYFPIAPSHPQPPEDGSGETGDDGYASVGGTTAASMRAWLRHMREFTYQVRDSVSQNAFGCASLGDVVLAAHMRWFTYQAGCTRTSLQ